MLEDVLVAPSVLSADFARLGEDLKSIETADYVHFDVMDGHFVPNLTFGPDVLRAIKATTDVPVDAHLMISNPDEMTRLYVEAGADIIMFDNMTHDDMAAAIELIAGRAKTECSGNVDASNIRALADLGVDFISSGALTHSAPILDLSLKHLRLLDGK